MTGLPLRKKNNVVHFYLKCHLWQTCNETSAMTLNKIWKAHQQVRMPYEGEIEVLVDPSTHMTNLIKIRTRDERPGLFVKFNCAAKLHTNLAFCTPRVKKHFKISKFPPHSTASFCWIREYADSSFEYNLPWLYIPCAIRKYFNSYFDNDKMLQMY